MKQDYEYIHMVCIGDTGKTTRWSVYNNKSSGWLGDIQWNTGWRQ